MLTRHSVWTRAALLVVWLILLAAPAWARASTDRSSASSRTRRAGHSGRHLVLVNTATSERREGVSAATARTAS